jgi:hypothetical protein
MFSSCSPWSALVDGVKSGVASLALSTRPSGSEMPWTVPDCWYSAQPEPAGREQRQFGLHTSHANGEEFTSDVAPNDGLDLDDLALADDHRPALELVLVRLAALGELLPVSLGRGERRRQEQVVGDDGRELVEPEERERGKELALVGD